MVMELICGKPLRIGEASSLEEPFSMWPMVKW